MRYLITFLLLILVARFYLWYIQLPKYENEQEIRFVSSIVSEPVISSKSGRFTAILPSGERVFITTEQFPQYLYGDSVEISGRLQVTLLIGHTVYSMVYPTIEKKESGMGWTALVHMRKNIQTLFHTALPQDTAALLLGIVFGIKEPMDKEFTKLLQTAGVMHIIAASGMNVTMVGAFLSGLAIRFFRRQIALLISIGGIFLYAAFAGFEPSIVRAAIMAGLVFGAQILGRQVIAPYLLFLTAWGMLLWDPYLLFDIGFQLSFAATAGLLFITPLFYESKRVKKVIEKSIIGEDVLTTITAQLSTLPILLVHFGSYSLISILVNALILWTIPILMIIGGIAAIIGLVIPMLGTLLLYLTLPLLFYIQKVITMFGTMQIGPTDFKIPGIVAVGYYLILLSVVLMLKKRSNF